MKKYIFIALLYLMTAINAFTQIYPNRCSYVIPKQADNWFFRTNAGIKFSDAGVIANNLPAGSNGIQWANGTGVISDADGNLMAYSDGMRVWNKNHEDISGPFLKGDFGSLQPALFVPNPSLSHVLYVFTTDILTPTDFNGLNYSIVDTKAKAGTGEVISFNQSLLPDAVSVVCATRNSDMNSYWVLSKKLQSTEFHAFLVDGNGVNTTPKISNGGSIISSEFSTDEATAMMKFSSKGDKIALSSFGKGTIEFYNFDKSSGTVTYVNSINVPLPVSVHKHGPHNIEFSPDGTKLYFTVVKKRVEAVNLSYLYQCDLSAGMTVTKINDGKQEDVWGLQLGRDGKIYVSRKNNAFLGAIENPNRAGLGCNYNENALSLGSATGSQGFPNFVSSFLDVPPVLFEKKCYKDLTEFEFVNKSNINSVTWNFGDPDSPDNIVSGSTSIAHMFSKPGNYTITYTEHFGGNSWTDSIKITVNELPGTIFEKDSAYIINGASIVVYALPNMYSYYWQDGSESIQYTVTQPGDYTVIVENMNCCLNRDTLYVTELNIRMPTAFSPDGNGINDYFRPIGPSDAVVDYTLSIFNKWGQMVWTTNNFSDKWDGKVGSTIAPTGLYNWRMSFNVAGNTMNEGMIKLNGTLMLFR